MQQNGRKRMTAVLVRSTKFLEFLASKFKTGRCMRAGEVENKRLTARRVIRTYTPSLF